MKRDVVSAVIVAVLALPISAAAGSNGVSSLPASASTPTKVDAAPSAECAAQKTLDEMDARTAVPLLAVMANHQKQNMRDHLLAVQEIVAALAADDFSGIERAAGRIGYSEQMGQMCEHMGAGAPGFTQQALAFHHTADTILDAARNQDPTGVLRALSSTLQTCTACHAAFRQQVVDEATWQRLTSKSPPIGHGHADEP